MPEVPDAPPAPSAATQAVHERLQRALLARGAEYAIPSGHPGGWREGPLGMALARGGEDAGLDLWLLVPVDPQPDVGPMIASLAALAGRLAPALGETQPVLVLTTSAAPSAATAQATESGTRLPVVAVSPAGVVAGPAAVQAGFEGAAEDLWGAPDEVLAEHDPGKAYAALNERSEGFQFFQALHRAVPTAGVTIGLIAACVAVWLVQVVGYGFSPAAPTPQQQAEWGANLAALTTGGEWWRLVTAGFLHYGIIHLGINMWILKDLGALCERLFGRLAFLALFLASVAGGCVASIGWHPNAVSAGASGGIFGLGGAVLGFMAVRRHTIPPSVFLRFRSSLGAFILFNVVFGLAMTGSGTLPIDNAAHLGGLATGFVGGALLSRPFPPPEGPYWLRWALAPVLVLALAGAYAWIAGWPNVVAERARYAAAGAPGSAVEREIRTRLVEAAERAYALEVPPDPVAATRLREELADLRRRLDDLPEEAGTRPDFAAAVAALDDLVDAAAAGDADARAAADAAFREALEALAAR